MNSAEDFIAVPLEDVNGNGVPDLVERSRLGQALGLGKGLCGWVFVLVCTVGPAFWLFPPQFVERVVVPMLSALNPMPL